MVSWVNPGVYLGWSLVLGPVFLAAWRQAPSGAVALLVSFYATMITMLAVTILVFGTTHFLGSGVKRALILAPSIALAGLGIYQLVITLSGL